MRRSVASTTAQARLVVALVAATVAASGLHAQRPESAVGLWATEGYGFVFDVLCRQRHDLRGDEGIVYRRPPCPNHDTAAGGDRRIHARHPVDHVLHSAG